jgi:DNA-3-methyladenine glycosylase
MSAKNNIVPLSEYLRDPFQVARDVLLGATLCSRAGGRLTAGKIVELEVYIGAVDRACHAYPNKKTPRNAVMFGPGGRAYVYFVYGMHNMFNVVVSEAGQPNAILIRALEPLAGIDAMQTRRGLTDVRKLCSGPAKLTQALGISTAQNGLDLTKGGKIWIEPRTGPAPSVVAGKRIGVDYAGSDADLPWRFAIGTSIFVSQLF